MLKSVLYIQFTFLYLLLSCSNICIAQLYHKSKNITIEVGLSNNRITCFYKDKTGFLWIGTKNGLNRYDGHSFKIFRPQKGNSISNETINDIAGDKFGRIWVATMDGLNCYNPATDQWEVLLPGTKKSKNVIPNILVWKLWFDETGLLWIASDVFEFTSYDINKKKFTYYNWPQYARQNLNAINKGKYNSIHRFVKKSQTEFWLGTTKGLVILDIKTNEFNFIGAGYYGDVNDLFYDSADKKVYLSAQGGRLFCYDEKSKLYKQIKPLPEHYPSVEFVNEPSNEIWMASEKGLLKINPHTDQAAFPVSIPLTGTLLTGGATAIYKDNTGIRWIGTPNGISSIDQVNLNSTFLPLVPGGDMDGQNNVSGVYFDSISNCYFVCFIAPAAVYIINKTTGKIDKVTKDKAGNQLMGCNMVTEDGSKNLWLLTRNNVYRYDRANKLFTKFKMPNNDSDVVYRDMAQDAEGNYWFASFHNGIYYYITATGQFKKLKDSIAFLLETSASSLYADNIHKEVWIGTFGNSLFKYNLSEKKLETFIETEKTKDYASLLLIDDICADEKNNIWVATNSGGLMRYNRGQPFEKAFSKFDMRMGMVTNNIISVATGADSIIWYLSGSGILAMHTNGTALRNIQDNRLFKFSTYVNDFSIPHNIYYAASNHELLIGVGGGLLIYYPQKKVPVQPFPLIFTEIKIDGKSIFTVPEKKYENLNLSYGTNSVTIQFAALYYGGFDELEFEYMLNGYDKQWQPAGKKYEITYQNLPEGNYSFKVRAVTNGNKVVANLTGLSFKIPPRFWQTWWFVSLFFILVIGVVYWIVHSLLVKLKEEEQLNAFATSLYGQSTIDDIFWDTAQNCISLLGFKDCVIYQKEEHRDVLTQRAAAGPKTPGNDKRQIINLLEIPIDKGVVGYVCRTGKPLLIPDTSKDPRYIIDDENRFSEITVPVFIDGKVFAVIDSEHPQKRFFTKRHLRVIKKIAGICAERISKYLSEERLRTKIARDLHDEMGSTLTSINVLSKVAMQSGTLNDDVIRYLQKIKDNSGIMMESMSDIVWAINPVNDSIEKVLIRMKEFTAEMLEPTKINYFFKVEGNLDKSLLNLEERKDLYMIFKESINNAIKYSNATEINIALSLHNNQLQLQITDNGIGFNSSKSFTGNGLRNMNSRAMAMKATLTIHSIVNTGTTILLQKSIT